VLAYAALGVVLVAPLVAAFSGVGVRRPGGQAATPKLPGVTQIAEGRFDALQSAQVPPYVVCVNLAAVHIGHWSHLQKSWL
jgi:hypothetical protein